jgi:hypothetical protein
MMIIGLRYKMAFKKCKGVKIYMKTYEKHTKYLKEKGILEENSESTTCIEVANEIIGYCDSKCETCPLYSEYNFAIWALQSQQREPQETELLEKIFEDARQEMEKAKKKENLKNEKLG